MSDQKTSSQENKKQQKVSRRSFIKRFGVAGATLAAAGGTSTAVLAAEAAEGSSFGDAFSEYFQSHYRKMTKEEITEALARLERQAKREWEVDIKIEAYPPIDNVVFGYALNISKCKGYRKCVDACKVVNNNSRDPEIEYIRVLEMDTDTKNLEDSNHYYNPKTVPTAGKYYMPVACHHCERAPCVRACPTQATWKEPDGIVVVDYNWCIGCHYCVIACPYWARRYNWKKPSIPKKEINTKTHYLSNRPRYRGVMEKCTFCLQRTRKGQLPACHEACPTGARVFGNLLDPKSEIRYILENKTIFRLKEELNTEPKFWYYTD